MAATRINDGGIVAEEGPRTEMFFAVVISTFICSITNSKLVIAM